MRVIYGRTEHKAVGLHRLFAPRIHDVVPEHAAVRLLARSARDAVLHGLRADPENFRFDPLFAQNARDLAKRRVRAPLFVNAAVKQ